MTKLSMSEEEMLKRKYTRPYERRIAELEKENAELKDYNKKLLQSDIDKQNKIVLLSQKVNDLQKENAELKKIAEFQQSSNMNTHLENKKIKEVLAVGSMWNKHLNSQNKALEEERDKYRDMTFDQREQLTEAKELLKKFTERQRKHNGYGSWQQRQNLLRFIHRNSPARLFPGRSRRSRGMAPGKNERL